MKKVASSTQPGQNGGEASHAKEDGQHGNGEDGASFPIVGIGSSAGGLEALEQFLGDVPRSCGVAFIIVQHLDPDHKGMMVELLQRTIAMPVMEIKDRMKVEAGKVYLIPPNRDLSILHGCLHLFEPVALRGLRLPIDFFLRSLAEDRQDQGIGVILSGMGSDGTLGLRAIKEKGGAVFVQEPASAKFDGMPRSAIDAGLADIVAPAAELATRLLAYLHHVAPLNSRLDLKLADDDQSSIEKILLLVRAQTGHDFSLYKKNTIYRRIERRMGLHQLSHIAEYVLFLRENSQEIDLLFKELLIGVTSFFRDPALWEQLRNEVIPSMLKAHPKGATLRAWVAGCSTGEEAYSLAIVFREALETMKPAIPFSMQVFATDLDKDAIEKARAGVYPANIAADIDEARLRRFFTQEEHGYRVNKEIREMMIFAPQNLVMDPPFTKLDILTCRNLLIYLEAELQKKILSLFHFSLLPDGILVLGNSESAGQAAGLFSALPGKMRIYKRQGERNSVDFPDFHSAFDNLRNGSPAGYPVLTKAIDSVPNLQSLTEGVLLRKFSPAAVLTTDTGDIVYISGKTGKYLEPAAGKANMNIFGMAREGLSLALNEAFSRALRQKSAVEIPYVEVEPNGVPLALALSVQLLAEPPALQNMILVVFSDLPQLKAAGTPGRAGQSPAHSARLEAMTREFQEARAELQTAREEMQTHQEELKSANEELQSMNEELQSTNEELTTSKEEMQSMNEELQTVNHELLAKVDELTQTSDDLKNLFNCNDIATLILDGGLKVRRFTTRTAEIIKLIPGDAGRLITDIVSTLDYPALADDAHEVLRTLVPQERQVAATNNRWFTVRLMPYRTQDNRIDGLVITFLETTIAKRLENGIREALSAMDDPRGDALSATRAILERYAKADKGPS
jgi:two-component system CheB/CheR fusion protein